jgi:hypothetical protein
MPWLAISTDGDSAAVKNSLAQAFSISGLPTSLVLDVKTGNYITDDARMTVSEIANGTKEQGMNLIQKWSSMEAVPVEQAAAKRKADEPKQNLLVAAVMYILKNPMYIFGMLYIFKFLKKKYEAEYLVGGGDDGDTGETGDAGASAGEF